jgi:hypothetical protein
MRDELLFAALSQRLLCFSRISSSCSGSDGNKNTNRECVFDKREALKTIFFFTREGNTRTQWEGARMKKKVSRKNIINMFTNTLKRVEEEAFLSA